MIKTKPVFSILSFINNKCIYLCILIFTLATHYSIAQQHSQIKGLISDKKGNTIGYASIGVFRDSTFIGGVITDSTGHFSIRVPKMGLMFTLRVSAIGYKISEKEINDSNSILIELEEEYNQLSEVKVIAKKPLIEKKIDRLIFNVENSIVKQGVTALEALKLTPNVDVSENGVVRLIGKDKLSIMIDGRILYGEDLQQRLTSIKSDNIVRIEVITTPPSKYSAEGNSGILNIILKKNPLLGWVGYADLSLMQRTYTGISSGTGINYKNERLDLSVGISNILESKKYTSNNSYITSDKLWNNINIRKSNVKNISFDVNLNYKINDKMQMGVLSNISFEKSSLDGNTISTFYKTDKSTMDSLMNTPSNQNSDFTLSSITAYYDYLIDTLGKKISINTSVFSKNTSDIKRFESTINSIKSQNVSNYGNASYVGKSVSLDIELPYTFTKIETGLGLSMINNSTGLRVYNSAILDTSISNNFQYKEYTYSLYLSANKDWKKWSTKLGLRFEGTNLTGLSETINKKTESNYSNIFPTIYIGYNANENHSYSIAYSKRIERPLFYYLNPFRIYSSPYSYTTGNPFLLPSFSNNLDLGYTFMNNLSLGISGSILDNGLDYYTSFNSGNTVTISKPDNYFKQYRLGFDISHMLSLFKRLNSYNSVNISYNQSISFKPELQIPDVEGYGYVFSSRNTIQLNSTRTTFLEINYLNYFPGKYGFYETYNRSNLAVGVRFKALHKTVQCSLMASDILKLNYNKGERVYGTFKDQYYNYNDMQYFSMSLSYSFGNSKVIGVDKNINNPDKNRSVL